jgi:hypothetical protein
LPSPWMVAKERRLGIFDFFGTSKEFKTQLMFYDDGSFEFKRRLFSDTCLIEKKDEAIVKAWKHFYSTDLRFDGYRGFKADMIAIGFDRDFILDLYDKVPVSATPNSGKPDSKSDAGIKAWTAQVAEAQRYKVMNKPTTLLLWDKITMWLGIGLVLELIALGISKATG